MPNILDAFKTKKGKKEWRTLPEESKIQVITVAIHEKYGKVMAQEIAKSIIAGGELEVERIYNNHVSKIDEYEIESAEWHKQVDVLLSYIRMKHLAYISKAKE